MRTLLLLGLVVATSVTACASNSSKPATPPTVAPAPPRTAAEKLVDALCACRTAVCLKQTVAKAGAMPDKEVLPHKVALFACRRKAQVHAAADIVAILKGLVGDYCACSTAACQKPVVTKIVSETKLLDDFDKVVFLLPKETISAYENAAEKIATCSKGAVSFSGSEEADKMGSFATRMCECKDDSKCAQDTHKEMMTWIKQHFKGGKKKGTKRNVELWKKSQQKLNKCYIEAMKAGMKKEEAKKKKTPTP